MDIERVPSAELEVVKVRGRLDAQWADHLGRTLEEVIRQGRHRIVLDASGIDYLSSAGIRVLLICDRRLKSIGGRLTVVDPSSQVRTVLSMSGLHALMEGEGPSGPPTVSTDAFAPAVIEPAGGSRGRFEVIPFARDGRMTASIIGRPDAFISGIDPGRCRPLSFPVRRFGLGLGAFGDAGTDCRNRLGEFLAVGGMATCLTAGGTTPDYLVGAGDFIPEVLLAYGLVGEGGFSHLIRFEAIAESGGVGLGEIVTTCLRVLGEGPLGLVMVGENAGLVGASLRSLVPDAQEEDFFAHPGIRHRLTFTTERAYPDSVSVVAGFAVRGAVSVLDPFLRPLGGGAGGRGHFHAAVFSYRPLPRQITEPSPFVAHLFKEERLQGLLHLLADDRPIVGVGESEWVRGACWAAPLDCIDEEVCP